MTLHRRSRHAECKLWLQLLEQALLEVAAGRRIADDADQMPCGDLRFGEVAHMPEDASDRRPKAVHDPQFPGHGPPAAITEIAVRPSRRAKDDPELLIEHRNNPKTGSTFRSDALEQALADIDRVSRQKRIGNAHAAGYHLAVDVAGDVDAALVGARREAAGDGDRLLHGEAGDV